jgi:Lipocalin-like domain
MNRRSVITISAITMLGVATLPGTTIAQQKSLKEQLVGTWSLVAYNSIGADGSKKPIFGARPAGTLMLDANGHYAMVLADPGRVKWKANLRTQLTTEDLGTAARGLVAQFGTWSVEEPTKTLTRKIQGALSPNLLGAEQKVTVVLSGDELTTATDLSGVTGGKAETVFRRAR